MTSDVSYRLLVVDDEPDLRELLKSELSDCAQEIFEAEDGLQAVELAKNHKVHCIVSDITMPKKNGFEMIKTLRSLRIEAPVLLVTGFEDPQFQLKALQYGAVAILPKPWDHSVLNTLVQRGTSIGYRLQNIEAELERRCRLENVPDALKPAHKKSIREVVRAEIISELFNQIAA